MQPQNTMRIILGLILTAVVVASALPNSDEKTDDHQDLSSFVQFKPIAPWKTIAPYNIEQNTVQVSAFKPFVILICLMNINL